MRIFRSPSAPIAATLASGTATGRGLMDPARLASVSGSSPDAGRDAGTGTASPGASLAAGEAPGIVSRGLQKSDDLG